MTHPLSKAWRQPDRSLITIDDTHALVPAKVWDDLVEYSATNPTGAYEGKIWKRIQGWEGTKYICWYGFSYNGNPDHVSINCRVALVIK